MNAREEIADALYLLQAGSDPDTFLRTLRTYVLQHIETTERALELLRGLASVNPPAFAEALKTLTATQEAPITAQRLADVRRVSAEMAAGAATIKRRLARTKEHAASAQPKKLSKRGARSRDRRL
ncbi:MAG TPA: hypothetical protein VE907_14875 [Gammaproteobacteria bacterium]|nr:hypothetical protein [Gammaproteobacteria bacterium]